jgi:hypothetical protein
VPKIAGNECLEYSHELELPSFQFGFFANFGDFGNLLDVFSPHTV